MTGFVYFIAPEAVFSRREEDSRVVKIGYTKFHPSARLQSLQTGSPAPLEIIAYIDGDPALEKAFHKTFAELQWRGEWFLLDRKLHDFLHYFSELPCDDRYVSREMLGVSLYDNVFAPHSSHPKWTDEEYLQSAKPDFLRNWFPEAVQS